MENIIIYNQLKRNQFSKGIRYILKEYGKTRRQVSDDLNITYTTLCDYVKGRTYPNPYNMELILDYFDITLEDVYKINDLGEITSIRKLKMISRELKKEKNLINVNNKTYIRKDLIERIVGNYE